MSSLFKERSYITRRRGEDQSRVAGSFFMAGSGRREKRRWRKKVAGLVLSKKRYSNSYFTGMGIWVFYWYVNGFVGILSKANGTWAFRQRLISGYRFFTK